MDVQPLSAATAKAPLKYSPRTAGKTHLDMGRLGYITKNLAKLGMVAVVLVEPVDEEAHLEGHIAS